MSELAKMDIGAPPVVDRETFESHLDMLLRWEKAHLKEGDAIAAARRRLPMVKVDETTPLIGKHGATTLLDAFEARTLLIAYYYMWYEGRPATGQCEGCTYFTSQLRELSYLHSRDTTFAVLCQGPYQASAKYRDFMGWTMPWYSARQSLDTLLVGRRVGHFYLVCYLRRGNDVFETYWTTGRGDEKMDNTYSLLELTAYGRQETWEELPPGWPQSWDAHNRPWSVNGRPIAQWQRVEAGFSDDLT